MITPFSKEIQREFANYLNKLYTFNDYFQLFFAHSSLLHLFELKLSSVFVCENTG